MRIFNCTNKTCSTKLRVNAYVDVFSLLSAWKEEGKDLGRKRDN